VVDEGGGFMLKGRRLMAATPPGEKPAVPTITWAVVERKDGRPVQGSIVLCETLLEDDASFGAGKESARLYSDLLCGSTFYSALKTTPTSSASFSQWEESFNRFAHDLASPFFLGDTFTLTDAVVFPFLWRARSLQLFERYKNYQMTDQVAVEKVERWIRRCLSLPYVRSTLPNDTDDSGFSKRLFDLYDVYVNGSGLQGLVRRENGDGIVDDVSLPLSLRGAYKRG
jgi:hypothetical protein